VSGISGGVASTGFQALPSRQRYECRKPDRLARAIHFHAPRISRFI
jgi:hypothetical protein